MRRSICTSICIKSNDIYTRFNENTIDLLYFRATHVHKTPCEYTFACAINDVYTTYIQYSERDESTCRRGTLSGIHGNAYFRRLPGARDDSVIQNSMAARIWHEVMNEDTTGRKSSREYSLYCRFCAFRILEKSLLGSIADDTSAHPYSQKSILFFLFCFRHSV